MYLNVFNQRLVSERYVDKGGSGTKDCLQTKSLASFSARYTREWPLQLARYPCAHIRCRGTLFIRYFYKVASIGTASCLLSAFLDEAHRMYVQYCTYMHPYVHNTTKRMYICTRTHINKRWVSPHPGHYHDHSLPVRSCWINHRYRTCTKVAKRKGQELERTSAKMIRKRATRRQKTEGGGRGCKPQRRGIERASL